jgi:DNA-3-methyladenine glycosylase
VPRFRRIRADEIPAATIDLAKTLIGCVLVRDTSQGRTAGRIVETEAYVVGDPASHAFGGKSKRNASMFLGAHRAYVYKIYGTSFCVNVTSEGREEGAAVLIRALEPLEGVELMEKRRKTARPLDLCRGPGRLCQALAIDGSLDGADLLRGRELWLAAAADARPRIGTSRRIGITKAAHRRLRFFERGSPYVSGPRHLSR